MPRITFVYCRIEAIKVMWWCYIEDVTWPLGDTNFIFECWKYLSRVSFAHSSLTRERCLQHSKIKFVSPSGHVTSNLHRLQWRYYFYLSRLRILVSPWLQTWLPNYERASRSIILYYCLYFSFITLCPSFITFLWQAFCNRWPLLNCTILLFRKLIIKKLCFM